MFTDSYCNLVDAKEACGVEGTEKDSWIKLLVQAASRAIDKATSCYWGPTGVVSGEVVKNVLGPNWNIFYTRWAPIVSVSSLSDDLRTYAASDYTLDSEFGRIELNVASLDNLPMSFSRTTGKVVITYTAGQGVPASGLAAPPDIQVATAYLAAMMFKAPDRFGVGSRSKGETSTSFKPLFKDGKLPDEVLALIPGRIRYIF